jgi:two-component system phosphate regulon sensor histidine kinase PhoR
MKRSFQLITILILLSVVGIILIQYSWLKNVMLIKDEQVRDRVDMVEYEVVEREVRQLIDVVDKKKVWEILKR